MGRIRLLHGFMGKPMNHLNHHQSCLLSLICLLLPKGVGEMPILFPRTRRRGAQRDGKLDVAPSILTRRWTIRDPDVGNLDVKVSRVVPEVVTMSSVIGG
jgi:hypothetical protein